MTQEQKKLTVKFGIYHDQDTESPFENSQYALVTFKMDLHTDTKKITLDDVLEEYGLTQEDKGKRYRMLSCYRHSGSFWFVKGSRESCQWDTRVNAGVLILTQPEHLETATEEELATHAQGMIDSYNEWCNGNNYCYDMTAAVLSDKQVPVHDCPSCACGTRPADPELIEESCGGFIGLDPVLADVALVLKSWHETRKITPETHTIVVKSNSHVAFDESDLKKHFKLDYKIQRLRESLRRY